MECPMAWYQGEILKTCPYLWYVVRAECDIQSGSLLTRLTLGTTGVILNLGQICSCSDAVS